MGVSHRLRVDCSERNAALLKLASECGDFEVSVVRLRSGDYLVDDWSLLSEKLTRISRPRLQMGDSFRRPPHSLEVLIDR